MGAHLLGGVCYEMGSRPGLIFGLDPADPLFDLMSDDIFFLDKSDAQLVVILHTNSIDVISGDD